MITATLHISCILTCTVTCNSVTRQFGSSGWWIACPLGVFVVSAVCIHGASVCWSMDVCKCVCVCVCVCLCVCVSAWKFALSGA